MPYANGVDRKKNSKYLKCLISGTRKPKSWHFLFLAWISYFKRCDSLLHLVKRWIKGMSPMLLHSTDTKDKDILHAILSTIDEGIHAVDANGVTIFYNHIASKHDDIEGENILGKHLLDIFPSLTSETSTLLKVIQTGESIYNQQQSYYNSRGVLIDTVNTTLPIIIKGEVVGAV